MSLNIQEKYSELKEELNGKNPFVKYNLLREELDNKDPIKRYVRIKEELDFIKEENVRKFEEDIEKREKNTLESLENLFESLGGDEEIIEATEDGTDELITQYKEITPGEKSKSE